MKKSMLMVFVCSVMIGGIQPVFAESKAFLMGPKWFKDYRVNVDGKELSIKEFKAVAQEKSQRTAEQISIYQQNRMGSGFMGFLAGCYGYRRYNDIGNYSPDETARIARAQSEGILFYAIAAIMMVNEKVQEMHAIEALNRAVDYFNEDTGKVVARTTDTKEYNLSFLGK